MGTFRSPDGFQIVVLPNRPLRLFGFFQILRIEVEVTDREVVFGIHPYRDEPDWPDARVGKEEFLSVWAQAAACIEAILAEPEG